MRRSIFGVLGVVLFATIVVSIPAPADATGEVFVVSSSLNADANYLRSNGDGTFGDNPLFQQEVLLRSREFDFQVSRDFSYGNGLGDFDGDGDLDYVMAVGMFTGKIYIYEKTGTGNQFARPYYVDSWGTVEGSFPMDIAVADFDGDEDMDFVLALGWSSACGLYLNHGAFQFESKLLPDTAPDVSYGTDAADFDNDGDTDFVVAAGSDGLFYINLNNDDVPGSFSTHTFDSSSDAPASGIAAADFTGDGIVDIVAGAGGYLDVYEGQGDGKTFTRMASYPLPINRESAIDNFDFDSDGNPDLVIGNYGDDVTGVAVLLGTGDPGHPDGLFRYTATYLGGTGSTRNAISGPPYKPVLNKKPVAVIDPGYLEVTAGQEINFDGSHSFDEDGHIVSYEWDFGEIGTGGYGHPPSPVRQAASKPRVKGVNPVHTYFRSGNYQVTLWVTDDQGATTDVQAEVVVKPFQARVKFYPGRLYIGSKGKYLWAKIMFPKGVDARKVNESSLYIVPDNAPAIYTHQKTSQNFFDRIFNKFRKRKKSITVRFDRQAVLAALGCPPEKRAELKIQGEIYQQDQWLDFESMGSIRTKMRKRHRCAAE